MFDRLKMFLLRRKLGLKRKNIEVSPGSIFSDPENIIWHDNIYIGPFAFICAVGGLEIGDNVIIGPRVTIHTSNHRYENATMLPYDGVSYLQKVTIEKNVWIGDGVMIVPGVTVGEGAVIAMGSVVTRDVPKFALVGGNPARVLKERDRQKYQELDDKGMHYFRLKKENKVVNQYICEKK